MAAAHGLDLAAARQWAEDTYARALAFNSTELRLVEWFSGNYHIPFAAVAVYVVFVFTVPHMISKPLPLKHLFGLWNLLLSLFSALGVAFVVPQTLYRGYTDGMKYSLCGSAFDMANDGLYGLFIYLFAISKLPELFDTVFLVLLKKDVMLLHWYHHVTVLLYCWHGYAMANALGLWSATMNYTVHAIMYFYFFASTLCKDTWWFRKLLAPYSMYITMLQLAQMVVGMVLLGMVIYWKYSEKIPCLISDENIVLGMAMYASYFVLFAKLFYDSYVAKTRKNAAARMKKKQ